MTPLLSVALIGCAAHLDRQDTDGDGVFDSADRCPTEPEDRDGFQDEDGCSDADNDADGIADIVDKCPQDPEDRDGFEDEDGCPDPDNDADGVLDSVDKCPDQPMIRHGGVDPSRGQGCPDDLRPPVLVDPR